MGLYTIVALQDKLLFKIGVKMRDEVNSAVNFLSNYLSTKPGLSFEQIELFRDNLVFLITERFQNHWHPSKPLKGNAYRCLNVDSTTVDPVIVKASFTIIRRFIGTTLNTIPTCKQHKFTKRDFNL